MEGREADRIFPGPGWRKLNPLLQTARLLTWWDKLLAQAALVEGGAIFQLPINAGSKLKQISF
jgi:hypothetical protein